MMVSGAAGRDFRRGCLRSLKYDDMPLMLEWMHDPSVAGMFRTDFASLRAEDVKEFIRFSWMDGESIHFAISGKGDEYLGTVSLKNLDRENGNAEYAISMRRCAHGGGAALMATREVLNFAFDDLGLHRVYLNVRADNPRAIRFYEKTGFVLEGVARDVLKLKEEKRGGFVDLLWFALLEDAWHEKTLSIDLLQG